MHFPNLIVLLLSSLALGVAASPTDCISSQSLVQPRDEAGPQMAMIYARARKSKGKSKSSSDKNLTVTTTSSASGPVMVGGYAPVVLGMGMLAVLGLNVL